MSKRASPFLIGWFVLGAVALAIAAIVIISGGLFQEKNLACIVHFPGSLKGLRVGAPVTFRGVRVGSVTEINLVLAENRKGISIPVTLEIEPHIISNKLASHTYEERVQTLQGMIDSGLRAELQLQSMLTGQLSIDLGFRPEHPPRLVGGTPPELVEIPTNPSPTEAMLEKLEKIPIEEIFQQIQSLTAGLDQLVNSKELADGTASLVASLGELRTISGELRTQLPGLLAKADGTAVNAQALLGDTRANMNRLTTSLDQTNTKLQALIERADQSVRILTPQAEKTLVATEGAAAGIRAAAAPGAPLQSRLLRLLEQLDYTSQTVQSLSDYLERHPESLLRGKGEEK